MVTISFPGLGIGEFTVNRVAFTIGGFNIYWYAVIITVGVCLGVGCMMYRTRHEEGIKISDVADYAIWTIPVALIGARLYYVLTSPGSINSFSDVFSLRNGGIAIYGAVIAGAAAVVVITKVKKFKKQQMLQIFDLVAPGVMLGQIIGRWGNFINGEAHGTEIKGDFFLRMGLKDGAPLSQMNKMTYYHPTFLYESLWNLVGFVIINLLYRKKKYNGQIFLMYLAWYGFGRMWIEGLRTDSLMLGPFRISQVVAFLCFVICTGILIYLSVRNRRLVKDGEEYTSVYERSRGAQLTRRRAERAEAAEQTSAATENDTVNKGSSQGEEKE